MTHALAKGGWRDCLKPELQQPSASSLSAPSKRSAVVELSEVSQLAPVGIHSE